MQGWGRLLRSAAFPAAAGYDVYQGTQQLDYHVAADEIYAFCESCQTVSRGRSV